MMITVNKLLSQGQGLSPVLLRRAASVELAWDVRQKSRFDATDSTGKPVAVFLARGQVVRGGDVMVAEDGTLLRVIAKPQPVMVVRACAAHGSAFDMLRAAYHLGNRHVPLQLEVDHLKLEPDHVLAAMLRRMHLIVTDEVLAFEPEAGAYAAGAGGHSTHDHAAHDHAAHDHAAHDAAAHNHAGRDRAGQSHSGQDHAVQQHAQTIGAHDLPGAA